MENLIGVAKLLGEENEQKIKDGIIEGILRMVEADLEEYCKYEYVVDFESFFSEVQREVEKNVKEKLVGMYSAMLEENFTKWLADK